MTVTTGLDALLEDPVKYLGRQKVALVTNHTGVTRELASAIDAFHEEPRIDLVAIFGPEHGARGDVQDALSVESQVDSYTGLPVYSLYGEHMSPPAETLDGVDAMVFDIQDCGARFYTYVSTLTHCMEAAAEHGVEVYVLDRPDPINGLEVEGNILEPGFASFIGLHPVPTRHGLTVGELAQFINRDIRCSLTVVEMRGWRREMWYDETGLQWVQPSPNIPTLDTATVFPGTCFFEGVNTSEGRGTTRPFEYIGAPYMDGAEWARQLNSLCLPGARFRACFFTPAFWEYKDEQCSGVQVHVTDRDALRPVETGMHMLRTLIDMHPGSFKFNEPTYEERRHFDLLAGTDRLRRDLTDGADVQEILASWEPNLNRFKEQRELYLLYGDGVR
ncbi:DUF1343 domain-containing protein [Candidatus Bathyarchaeota archaeon]|nr:DUF1343 domain-containing protein [Candidatus Bathyarchaeota archaeon]